MSGLDRILVVDDEPDILAVTRMTLRARGSYQVEGCGSGREALELAPQFDPDLILLDVMMPEMDGPTTLAALRADPRTETTPVVFMTAKTMRHETDRYIDLGAVGVIAKPYDPRTLVDEIERITRGVSANLSRSADSEMTALLDAYAARLPAKIREVRELWSRIETGSDETAEDLERAVHRIAGAAGTYGYASLSAVASQLEQALKDQSRDAAQPTPESRQRVGSLIDALEDASAEPPKSL